MPRHFTETDSTILRDAVRQIRAGELITCGADGLEASFVPLLISDDAGAVTGHLAKANGQWKRADLSIPALVSWIGPYAYVSPSYYPSKVEDGRVVPTWNYTAIQAKGVLALHHENEWKRQHLDSLVTFHEREFPSPWSLADAPGDFIHDMVNGIVGVEIKLTSLVGKWKLSQNRPASDITGVITGLGGHGPQSTQAQVARAMADAMARGD